MPSQTRPEMTGNHCESWYVMSAIECELCYVPSKKRRPLQPLQWFEDVVVQMVIWSSMRQVPVSSLPGT